MGRCVFDIHLLYHKQYMNYYKTFKSIFIFDQATVSCNHVYYWRQKSHGAGRVTTNCKLLMAIYTFKFFWNIYIHIYIIIYCWSYYCLEYFWEIFLKIRLKNLEFSYWRWKVYMWELVTAPDNFGFQWSIYVKTTFIVEVNSMIVYSWIVLLPK